MVKKINERLKGNRTFILATVALVVISANFFGFVDAATANALLGLLGFGSIITLRAGFRG